jgi:hypothetical protein
MQSNREARELQNLRQRQASNVIRIDPNLRGFTQRFDPDASRAAMLRAQRARLPTAAELEKAVGVKTAKKLRRRKGKNLRGEVARNIREQRRFERGERREKPEQEPRIVGDPPPAAPGGGYDPALERRRLDLEEARERNRQLERIADRRADQERQERELAVRRGELAGARADRAAAAQRLAAPDPDAQLRLAIEGRRITAQDAQQRRLVEALEARDIQERGEREQLLEREREERADTREDIRRALGRGEAERGALLEAAAAERRRTEELRVEEIREERGERALLAERGERRRVEDREARLMKERERAAREVEREERERAERISHGREAVTERVEESTRAERERRQESAQSHEERLEIIDRLSRQNVPDPVPEERESDRNFLERQLDRGLETIDRRIGESEARTAEQIRQHADRVSGGQPPIIIQQTPTPEPAPAGPSAQEIAESIRLQLESPGRRERRERRRTQRRVPIEEETTDTEEEEFSPTRSERRRRREGRGAGSPREEVSAELYESEEVEAQFSPVQSPRRPSPERLPSPPREQVREEQPEGAIQLPGGDIDPFAESEPAIIREEDLFQSQEFQGNLEAAAQNAMGFVGDIAGGALGGLRGLFQADPVIGEQTGGALVTQEGEPIYGLGEEIEPQQPTIQELQSDPPERRPYKYVPRDPSTGPSSQTLEQFQAERRERQRPGLSPVSPVSPRQEQEQVGQETLSPATPRQESSLEESLRVAESELSTLQRRNRGAGQSGRQRAQSARSVGSFAGTRFARKAGGVPPAELERAEEEVTRLRGLLAIQREGERIREITEEAREAGTPRQGFTTEAPVEPLLQEVNPVAAPSEQRTNAQLFDSIEGEIDANYTRGRATGGARGSLPFTITNTTNRKYKGLEPGQSVNIDQVEKDGKLGYYPTGQILGKKTGITRISREELKRQIKQGKLKVDRKK